MYLIEAINVESYFYNVMDLLFAGEIEEAQKSYSSDVIQCCMLALNKPMGRTQKIYIDFAEHFGMLNKYKHKRSE